MSHSESPPPSRPPQPPGFPGPMPGRGESTGRIERVTGILSDVKRPQKLDGEITGINRDGSLRIRTEHGEMDVRLRGRAVPAEGQRVEIEIPAGRPPRQALIRPAPERPDALPESQNRSRPQAQPEPRPSPRAPTQTEARTETRTETKAEMRADTGRTDAVRTDPTRANPAPAGTTPPHGTAPPAPSVPAKPPPAPLADALSPTLAAPPRPAPPPDRPPPAPLSPGDIVRLTPLPPGVAQAGAGLPPAAVRILMNTAAPLPALPPETNTGNAGKTVILPATALRKHAADQAAALLPPFPSPSAAGIVRPPFSQTPLAPGAVESGAAFVRPSLLSALSGMGRTAAFTLPSLSSLRHGALSLAPDPRGGAPLLSGMRADGTITGTASQPLPFSVPGQVDLRVLSLIPPGTQLVPPPAGDASPGGPDADESAATLMTSSGLPGGGASGKGARHAALSTPASPLILSQDAAHALRGTVTGFTTQNLPVLSLALPGMSMAESFLMPFAVPDMMAGTQIDFAAPARAGVPAPGQAVLPGLPVLPPESMPSYLFAGPEWPALEAMKQIVAQTDPQAMMALARVMPNPAAPSRMPAAALFFLAAVRSGDPAAWLGEKASDALRRAGRGDVASRLSRDFASLERAGGDAGPQEWRATALPLFWQDEVHKMILYYRQGERDQDRDGDRRENGTRFILDMRLNRMGPVQLDGLHRANRLDLIVRTQALCSETMQTAMKRKWVDVLELAGLSGELSFQSKPEQFVKITMPAPQGQVSI